MDPFEHSFPASANRNFDGFLPCPFKPTSFFSRLQETVKNCFMFFFPHQSDAWGLIC